MTTTPPYTDDDLRAEAAQQHYTATTDPDFMGIGEQMTDETWRSLSEDDFDAAQRAIGDLLGKAADVSEWAVNLGADGLEPSSNVLGIEAGETPLVRIHFAFHADMPEDARRELVMRLGAAMADLG